MHSTEVAERYRRFGWKIVHQLRDREDGEPYEYILEWSSAGDSVDPNAFGEHWVGLVGADAEAKSIADELSRELEPNHELARKQWQVFGRCCGCDDVVLMVVTGEAVEYAVVHLTWSRARERAPWPHTFMCMDTKALVGAMAEHEH